MAAGQVQRVLRLLETYPACRFSDDGSIHNDNDIVAALMNRRPSGVATQEQNTRRPEATGSVLHAALKASL